MEKTCCIHLQMIQPLLIPFSLSDASKTTSEKEGKKAFESLETKAKVVEIDANLERNVVDLLCNILLNLPVSTEDIKDALFKV